MHHGLAVASAALITQYVEEELTFMAATPLRKRTVSKRIVFVVPALILAFAFSFAQFDAQGVKLTPNVAFAASPCAGDTEGYPGTQTCNNRDPSVQSCSSNQVSSTASAEVRDPNNNALLGLVENRWSNGCETNWTRGTQYVGCGSYNCTRSVQAQLAWRYPNTSGTCYNWSYIVSDWNNTYFNPGAIWDNMEFMPSQPTQSKVTIGYYDPHQNWITNYGAYSVFNDGFGTPCI